MRAGKPEEQFEERDDKLLVALRAALRPEALPPTLRQRVLADLHGRSGAGRRPGLRTLSLVGLAAAACVLVAVMVPSSGPQSPDSAVALSSGEAAEIVAAYGVLTWDSPVDYTLDMLQGSLHEIQQTLRRDSGSSSLLPSDRGDDWDVPPPTEKGASQSVAEQGALCLHGRDRELCTRPALGAGPASREVLSCVIRLLGC
jgi:hypothetical protein